MNNNTKEKKCYVKNSKLYTLPLKEEEDSPIYEVEITDKNILIYRKIPYIEFSLYYRNDNRSIIDRENRRILIQRASKKEDIEKLLMDISPQIIPLGGN